MTLIENPKGIRKSWIQEISEYIIEMADASCLNPWIPDPPINKVKK